MKYLALGGESSLDFQNHLSWMLLDSVLEDPERYKLWVSCRSMNHNLTWAPAPGGSQHLTGSQQFLVYLHFPGIFKIFHYLPCNYNHCEASKLKHWVQLLSAHLKLIPFPLQGSLQFRYASKRCATSAAWLTWGRQGEHNWPVSFFSILYPVWLIM